MLGLNPEPEAPFLKPRGHEYRDPLRPIRRQHVFCAGPPSDRTLYFLGFEGYGARIVESLAWRVKDFRCEVCPSCCRQFWFRATKGLQLEISCLDVIECFHV